jgi:hypothetical protein
MDRERNAHAARRRLVVLHVIADNRHKTAFTVEGLNRRMSNRRQRRRLPLRLHEWKTTQLASDLRELTRTGLLDEVQVIDTKDRENRVLHNRRAYTITDAGRRKLKGAVFYG